MKLSMHRHFILLAIAILLELNKVGSSRRRWQSNGKCDVNVIFNTGNVNCGSHLAKTCSQCPCDEQGVFHDNSWCSGECQWSGSRFSGVCQMRQKAAKCAAVIFNRGNVNCGGHSAKTCSQCPCQRGVYMAQGAQNYCNQDCQWRRGACRPRRPHKECAGVVFNTGNVNCGGHRAKTCSQCLCNKEGMNMGLTLEGRNSRIYCNGDCQWRGDNLSGVCHMRRNITKGEWHSWDTSRSLGDDWAVLTYTLVFPLDGGLLLWLPTALEYNAKLKSTQPRSLTITTTLHTTFAITRLLR